MITLIAQPRGTGKTKRIIKMANEAVVSSSGNIIFVDDDKRHMYDLKHDLRFISMDEYPLKTIDEFFGFLCGIISNDYDIDTIFIDGLLKVMEASCESIPKFIDKLNKIGEQYEINFVMTISCTREELAEELHQYIIEEELQYVI